MTASRQKTPGLGGTGAERDKFSPAGECSDTPSGRQGCGSVQRWEVRAMADVAFQRWRVSGGRDIAARDAALKGYNTFLRASSWSGDLAFLRFSDACLNTATSTRAERERLAAEHMAAVTATVDHAVRTLRNALVADGRLS